MSSYIFRKTGIAFDEKKAVSALKKSGVRLIAIIENKKANVKAKKSKIIDELEAGMFQQAEIEVEQVIRDDVMVKAFDTLRCECYRLEDNIGAVASSKTPPSDLEQAICTVIWAADRVEGPELHVVKMMLGKKFGKEFLKRAMQDEDACVNQKVVEKLRYQYNAPPTSLKEDYLVNIAKFANVDYRPSSKSSDKIGPLTPSSTLAEKPASLSSEAIAKRYLSSARPVVAQKPVSSKRLGDLPQKELEDSRRSRQNVTPVVIAYLTL